MRVARRTMVHIVGLVLFQTALLVCGAKAETYPSRAITLIVPYPAGGPSDTLARVITERMKTALGQSVIIENVTGAGGSIGTGRVARSAPDGYTLVLGHNQTHVINAVTQNLQYDVVKDFEPVTLVADTPQWLVARKAIPPDDIKSFIAWLKQQDGKATGGAVGVGGPTDLAAAFFQKATGTKFQLVPYRGGGPLVQDMLAGQIDFTFGQAANYLGHVRSGTLKPFAVLAKKRWWAAPDVPTMDEAGVKGLDASFWHGLWAPRGTPKDVIARLNAAMVETLADETVKKRMADIGQEVWPADQQNPAALAAQQKAEIERWWPVIKAAGIKSE
ncbi:Bug family tripartite tricarboxylate transporter substrate binding protein [Rhodoplanes sp. Z2-YC6860]|uniref:Bug family tripartite tricarboxylate transporter substrate binding protein n=1 Tax=Rhodoplanes sp. Z2-YC6860 TaxID=674703 RepID=UPI00078B6C19|nr:tripartite tricarboxylate transporter substrate-binding protein [Rhodoplanes sp. Z2-YC6860]AMN41041.1 tricarboxylate binding receptor [Rhodoplanes sp. Z2-YC6860]